MAPNIPESGHDSFEPAVYATPAVPLTLKQVAAHATRDDCYLVIRDKVYNVTSFVKQHPGGDVLLTYAGGDATDVFAAFHPPEANKLLAQYFVGELAKSDRDKQSDFVGEVRRLRNTFKELGYFKSSKLYYFFKIAFNVCILMASIWFAHLNTLSSVFFGACLLGLFWQQCGWLAHDFLHHQVFEHRYLNNYVGLLVGNIFQGFSVDWWKNKHNTHHAAPNIHGQDPDIDTMPLLAWSDYALEGFQDPEVRKTMPKFLVDHQHLFFTPLLMMARISWALSSILWVRAHPNSRYYTQEVICLALHYIGLFSIMALCMSPGHAVLYFFASQFSCGLLLASAFTLNHNGMPILSEEESKSVDYFTRQIITGREVHPSIFSNFYMGGLNYQIVHHIFPSIPRHNFHKIQPLVESLCKKYKIPYHKTTFVGGMVEVFQRLAQISSSARAL